MKCLKCQGCMEYNSYERDILHVSMAKMVRQYRWACINCGFYIDKTILKNKLAQGQRILNFSLPKRSSRYNVKISPEHYIGETMGKRPFGFGKTSNYIFEGKEHENNNDTGTV